MSEPLVAAFKLHLERARGASAHTIAAYIKDLEEFRRYLATRNMTLPSATHAAIRGFLGVLAVDRQASTRARKLASIKSFYRYLVRQKKLDSSPAKLDAWTARAGSRYTPSRRTPQPRPRKARQIRIRTVLLLEGRLITAVWLCS